MTGFNPQTETSFETINVEDGINAFFKANSIEEARSEFCIPCRLIQDKKLMHSILVLSQVILIDETSLAKYLETNFKC